MTSNRLAVEPEFQAPGNVHRPAPVVKAMLPWWQKRRAPAKLNLALQGGGAHGAFTWGVLDALLDKQDLNFEGLSGSSAGAMNAVVFADGWMKGGRSGARAALTTFWTEVGKTMPASLVSGGDADSIGLSLAGQMISNWAALFAPAQLNPLDLNPLRDLLRQQVDFARLRRHSPFKLFVGATHAGSGKLRIFREHELTLDALLASACLPKIHHAIEIDGESYWDGGYSANPAVFPLFYECDALDVLLVLLNPLSRDDTPRTVKEIDTRISELAFSSNFMREMRMFSRARDYAGPASWALGRLERRLHKLRFHMIDSSDLPSLERSDTKTIAYGPFLESLKAQGVERGSAWLAAHRPQLGRQSTIDLKRCFD